MMKDVKYKVWIVFCLIFFLFFSQEGIKAQQKYLQNSVIYNGIPWFDDRGEIINAHGACILEEEGRYYLFGEYKSDTTNAFNGFSCYSSDDLVNWKFERIVLPVQKDGILGPNRVGERVKVMKCPSTGEYVMYMHADDMEYKDPYVGYATCKTIAGDYTFQGPLLFDGNPINRWDMGTFQDSDGSGYLLIHGGIIYRLNKDYHSAEEKVLAGLSGTHGESPAMFRKNGVYFFLFSNLTSWEKNDNFYYTAPSIKGPWMYQGLFAPEGSLTFNSQTTFVFPLKRGNDSIPLFMGDRWSYPYQASAATYVWMPMQVNGTKLFMPEYWNCWDIKTLQRMKPLDGWKVISNRDLKYDMKDWENRNGLLCSNIKGSRLYVPFKGSRIAITGETNSHSGYAKVSILDKSGKEIHSLLLDFYSKVAERSVRFISPELTESDYMLLIEVTGEYPSWSDKTKRQYGSDNCFINIEKIWTL
jgi:hypothetical protein